MTLIRTPEERFQNLPDFSYPPQYVHLDGVRVHYIDAGNPTGEVILFLHGEPTWSYLYRKLIPPLADRYRLIAMDFIGFGRSDKFVDREAYSFEMHRHTLVSFIEELGLLGITAVVQDWGGLLGLTVAAQHPERFARLVIMNTGLPTGEEPMSEAFSRWQEFARRIPNLPIGRIIRTGLAHPERLPTEVIAAYEAPFPDESYKAGAATWPLLVPTQPDDPAAVAMREARAGLAQWDKPALVMFSDGDPITRGGDQFFRRLIPTASQQPAIVIEDAGHFLQEEKGEEIAQHIRAFMAQEIENQS